MDAVRSFPLVDISIRSGGDGRTVEAYAAVWDSPQKVTDQQGTYIEQIARTSFDETIAERGDKPWPVYYNHAKTPWGTPSEVDSVPIGASVEAPRVDSRGLVTVSHYHNTERADAILESIRSGAITSQSFSGSFVESTPKMPRTGYHPNRSGDLIVVTRNKVKMREYGPASFAVYEGAAITGVRSLTIGEYQDHLLRTFLPAFTSDAALRSIVAALDGTEGAVDEAEETVRALMEARDVVPAHIASLAESVATAIDQSRASGDAEIGDVSDDSGPARSGRLTIARNKLRVELRERGIKP